jgi:hypothetical protein
VAAFPSMYLCLSLSVRIQPYYSPTVFFKLVKNSCWFFLESQMLEESGPSKRGVQYMDGTLAETAIIDYRLWFADQGRQTSGFHFRLQQTNRCSLFPFSSCSKQTEFAIFC